MSIRRLTVIVLLAALFAACAPAAGMFGGVELAQAQQRKRQEARQPNFFDLLFGGGFRRQFEQRQKADRPKAKRIIVAPRKPKTGVAVVEAAPKRVAEKVENAAKVLVIGDFMGEALHFGLEQFYAENPNVVVVNETSGLSGLVREDLVDWPVKVGELIEQLRPVAVVALMGMNDRQQIRTDAGKVEKLSEAWRAAYEARMAATVEAVRSRNVTLVWLGLPPVKSGAMSSDYLVFNEIYRAKVEARGGKFVDVWDGFTNAEGKFVSAGPDVNGQIVRLRNSDGIAMTRAAKEKLGFYAEKELRRLLGLGNSSEIAALNRDTAVQGPVEPEYDPAASGRTIVIAFDGPQVDGGDVLDGGSAAAADTASLSVSYELVAKGLVPKPRSGRIDAAWGAPDAEKVKTVDDLKAAGARQSAAPPAPGNAVAN